MEKDDDDEEEWVYKLNATIHSLTRRNVHNAPYHAAFQAMHSMKILREINML